MPKPERLQKFLEGQLTPGQQYEILLVNWGNRNKLGLKVLRNNLENIYDVDLRIEDQNGYIQFYAETERDFTGKTFTTQGEIKWPSVVNIPAKKRRHFVLSRPTFYVKGNKSHCYVVYGTYVLQHAIKFFDSAKIEGEQIADTLDSIHWRPAVESGNMRYGNIRSWVGMCAEIMTLQNLWPSK